ncbi:MULTISPECIES: hypothetical protein [Pseudomonas]|uniref:hypothetical protein n=1 Tax=Pseudomonas TaxID=286 RepID=UPI000B34DC69|nr:MULTISPECIES: hypothetical protein [Pseudomonas]PMY35942.1 hypothetical protein C1Y35_21835 [Pseudomonas sp. GW456-L14]PMY49515.1 hypothetical protein C1Y34_27925 [Pseudomonas sp. GW456-L12]PMY59502.1 hypothetical protein C1Y31_31545 [Pseudomonas sp. FW305-25]PMY60307.1 hypothetical protein C1Y32_31520 [Pseudomonas sp. FW126-L8]PNA69213.1 hypothetical protein C1Y33_31425 [Pseudomonas sp. FW305-76]
MSAKKLFKILVGLLVYLLITLFWFFCAVPCMWERGTDASVIVAFVGSMLWLASTASGAIYIIQRARS